MMTKPSYFKSLKKITAPPPSKQAQRRAIKLASEVFCENQAEQKAVEKEKKSIFLQGFYFIGRLIRSLTHYTMKLTRQSQFIAATATACVIAVTVISLNSYKKEQLKQEQEIVVIYATNSGNSHQTIKPKKIPPPTEEIPIVSTNEKSNTSLDFNMPQMEIPNIGIAADAFAAPSSSSLHKNKQIGDRSMFTQRLSSVDGFANQSAMLPAPSSGDKFSDDPVNPVKLVTQAPVSTFSIDVDTASYAYMRRKINQGRLPASSSVRIEELINYFDYDYALPENADQPFKPTVTVYPTPWNKDTKLMHIGIKGHDIVATQKQSVNLVFLLDVSGSMSSQDKLPLLKKAFKLMVNHLSEEDTVAIVTYAGRAGTVLEPTKVANKELILNALENLSSGGSTAGAQGIQQAYALAEKNYDAEGINRVILATDGDFNVGMSDNESLKKLVEDKRKTGITLSILGFGQGNYNDSLMQTLAQNGNGNAAYIDSFNEAQKVLVQEARSTLFTIAKDVKIQVEFNPAKVAEYRLIGYETRMLKREDFNNDKIDAGDVGSGHAVTAIYEITPVGSPSQITVDPLRYQKETLEDSKLSMDRNTDEYAYLKMRYKLPKGDKSKLLSLAIDQGKKLNHIDKATDDVRFATSVAAFGQLLKSDTATQDFSYNELIALATQSKGTDEFGYRSEFIQLLRLAQKMSTTQD